MTKRPNYVFDDELYHHGILGQRWGNRRFQNEDGSWTPEGRERYGKGGRLFQIFKRNKSEQQIKADQQKAKAKISYNTQKYKADLKLKAQKDKIARAAQEEREKIKQQAKNDEIARKEQNRLDRKQAKLDSKLAKEQNKAQDTATLKEKLNRTKKYSMSDDELERSIKRLKLEVEYNKQYALAASPNSALAKADRFFEGPTGQMVQAVAVAAIPKVAEQFAKAAATSAFKYANKEDRDKAAAEARLKEEEVRLKSAEVEDKKQSTANEKAKSESELKDAALQRKIGYSSHIADLQKMTEENRRANEAHTNQENRWNAQSQAKIDKERYISEQEQARLNRKNESEASFKDAETRAKNLQTDVERDKQYGGVKYKTELGREVETRGLIATNDENAQLDTRHLRESQENQRRLFNSIANQQVLGMKIDNMQKSEAVKKTTAETEYVKSQTSLVKDSAKNQRASAKLAEERAASLAAERRQQQEASYKSAFRNLHNNGYSMQDIADAYGISLWTVKKYLS